MPEESGRSNKNEFTRMKEDFLNIMTKDKKTIFYVCKIIELIFCIISVGVFNYPYIDFSNSKKLNFKLWLTTTVFVGLHGYTLINIILLLSKILGEQLPKKLLLMFSGVAAILCLIAGSLLIEEHNDDENAILTSLREDIFSTLIPCGICAILAGLVFALDTLLTAKWG